MTIICGEPYSDQAIERMETDSVKTVARQFIQTWSINRLHLVDELASPDLTVFYTHFSEPIRSADSFKAMLSQVYRCFPDIAVEVDEIVAEANQAVVSWKYRATHQSGEMFGVQPTGQSVEVAGMTRYRIANGKVQSERGVVDTFSLMVQLGAVPSPRSK